MAQGTSLIFLGPLCIPLSSSVILFPILPVISFAVSLSLHCCCHLIPPPLLLSSHRPSVVIVVLLSPVIVIVVSLSLLSCSLLLLSCCLLLLSHWCPPVVIPSLFSSLMLLLGVVVVIPPVIHPTSSCSWGWRQVVCLALSLGGHCGVLRLSVAPTIHLIGVGWVLCCSAVVFLFFWSWCWCWCWCSLSSLWAPGLFLLFLAGVVVIPGCGLVCHPVV